MAQIIISKMNSLKIGRRCFGSIDPHPKNLGAQNRIKRFYKNVEVVEHPRSSEFTDLVLNEGESVSLQNLSKRNQNKPFYGITLDGRPIKTLYKDDMVLPSYPLAVAVAEEWDANLHTIDLRIMHTNTMLSKGFRVFMDEWIVNHMKDEIIKVFGND